MTIHIKYNLILYQNSVFHKKYLLKPNYELKFNQMLFVELKSFLDIITIQKNKKVKYG
jgi:hypothetical protein